MNIYLLQPYDGNEAGKIISVSDLAGLDLIEQKIAREAGTRDYLVKPEHSTRGLKGKIRTRAFSLAPNFK